MSTFCLRRPITRPRRFFNLCGMHSPRNSLIQVRRLCGVFYCGGETHLSKCVDFAEFSIVAGVCEVNRYPIPRTVPVEMGACSESQSRFLSMTATQRKDILLRKFPSAGFATALGMMARLIAVPVGPIRRRHLAIRSGNHDRAQNLTIGRLRLLPRVRGLTPGLPYPRTFCCPRQP
jgi:hypothetical protein